MLNSHNLRMVHGYTEKGPKGSYKPLILLLVLFVIFISIVTVVAHGDQIKPIVVQDWTTEQYVNAIYLAEGGSLAQYPYGIRSVSVSNLLEARQVCFNTVRNNKKRFKNSSKPGSEKFIDFLARRYCPIGAGNDPKALNQNWIKNVTYFLNHPKETAWL